ncbi:multidrug efflux SMR transporter [Zavarzinia sp.]|uniref:DMT family transporter n=1 Tax=Zavarzinia sp. TaxID=2027920 RepID=UPI00356AF081
MTLLQAYGVLIVAILLELTGTSCLQASQQFTRVWPTLGMAAAYAASFYLLSLALRVLPISVAYAIWSGVGIVMIAAVGYVVFRQSLDTPALIGIGLIVAGVVVVNGFSETVRH